MDNFVWRSRARMVANFDLILTKFFVTYAFVVTFFYLAWISQFIKDVPVWALCSHVLLLDFLVGLRVMASLQLLSATDVGVTADEALRQSCAWQDYVSIFIFLPSGFRSVVAYMFNSSWTAETILLMIGFIVACLIYLLTRFIVFKFIQELERVVNCGSSESTKTNNLEIVVCVK